MDIRSLLQANCDKLLTQYHSNLETVLELQSTLIEDVLPSVADELNLDSEQMEWAREWLQDTQAIFQMLRREKFTRSFAMESVRKNIAWRSNCLWPPKPVVSTAKEQLRCLPDVCDPLGRPILIVEAMAFNDSSEIRQQQHFLIQIMEQFRLHLRHLNDSHEGPSPSLQFIVLLDLKEVSMKSVSLELLSWFSKEVTPRFPGMLAAVFMVNYSWTHSQMWSLVSRLIPARARSRVFFPSQKELTGYFTPSSLPKDYGGTLPPLRFLDDPLHTLPGNHVHLPESASKNRQIEMPTPTTPARKTRSNARHLISPTNILNPFFGYPVTASQQSNSLSLHHGRRRKRDLFRTLLKLFWRRWNRPINVFLWFIAYVVALRMWYRRWILQSSAAWEVLHIMWDTRLTP
ncbi:CRAL/TRIO domain-containing protein [Dendrothele bispora CBS 962.96]|uniref:CRAL/TRIO domain-containing protein n=1 Tax=Dendrothele bispora (strain CBS 962.96) TaxID=1314807 RepID=A0A4S8M4P7_DENBC|nr:CRAL/TRIO domain-containing protein [Dendrothele bispora CBS 962.96]